MNRVTFNTYQGLAGLGAAGDIITNDDGSYFIVDASGGAALYDADSNYVDYYPATSAPASNVIPAISDSTVSANGGQRQGDGGLLFPGVMNAAQQNALIQRLGATAGNYIARTVGGNTVLYPRNGGLASMNIQSMIIPLAAIAALFILGKK